jgi:hypothetical protein
MAIPNFFIVGAPKAGTTSLYRYLSQHPDVYVSPVKEPGFFAPELVSIDPHVVVHWHQYLDLFREARGQRAIGEGSVAYLSSPNAAKAIAARVPHARILMMLRDPADRLFSHYVAARTAGDTDASFLRWVNEQLRAESHRHPPVGPFLPGRYATHLERFLSVFPAVQVRPLLFDDYTAAPAQVIGNVLEFLRVDPTVRIDVRHRHNVTVAPRWTRLHALTSPIRKRIRAAVPRGLRNAVRRWSHAPVRLRMTPHDRERVISMYQDEIDRLEALLGRKLPMWRDPRRAR